MNESAGGLILEKTAVLAEDLHSFQVVLPGFLLNPGPRKYMWSCSTVQSSPTPHEYGTPDVIKCQQHKSANITLN
jgi:hypothetical protein